MSNDVRAHQPSRQAIVLQYLIDHPGKHSAVAVSQATGIKRTTASSILGAITRLGLTQNDMGYYSAIVKTVPSDIAAEVGRASPKHSVKRALKTAPNAEPGMLLVIELGRGETVDLTFEQARSIWARLNAVFGPKP